MYQPMLLSYLTTFIARDVIFYTITTISTSIISIQNINKFITEHKDNDYKIFNNNLEKMDLINKLNITNVLIKDIMKSHTNDKDKIDNLFNIITNFEVNIKHEDGFSIINKNENINNVYFDIPEPVKISILSTLEIIYKINLIFETIHKKIINYNNAYFNMYKLHIANEIQEIIQLDEIFDKRLDLLIKIINIYNQKLVN